MSRLSDEEVLAILAPFVTLADIKARNAREDAKRKSGTVKHFVWSADADAAREMGTQCRSACGRRWVWPKTEKDAPARVFDQDRDCKLCIRAYLRQKR